MVQFADEPALRRIIADLIDIARVPGIVLAVARDGGPVAELVFGTDASANALRSDTLFPVASITKLATALAVLRLADTGALQVGEPLSRYLPEAGASQPEVTLRALLCHTAGMGLDLTSEQAPYAPGLSWPALAAACLATAPAEMPGQRVQYSNIGYGLLGLVVERASGKPFNSALSELVLEPLGIEGYLGVEPPRSPAVLADIRGAHAGTELSPYNSRFWRSLGFPWGGLVTTAKGALALVQAFQGYPADFLHPETRLEAVRNQVGELGGGLVPPMYWKHCPWGLGPELRNAKQPHWSPPEAAPDSFGHSGASGCVAWCDPNSGVAWAILGARTADSGWLLRRAPAIGAAILAAF